MTDEELDKLIENSTDGTDQTNQINDVLNNLIN